MAVYISDPNKIYQETSAAEEKPLIKVTEYNVNSNKRTKVSSPPIAKGQTEKEIKEATPFRIASNTIKYLGATLTRQVKDLYDKSFKTLKISKEESSPMLMH